MNRRKLLNWIYIFGVLIAILLITISARAEERQWYTFTVDNSICIDVNADGIENAHCAISSLVEERKHSTYKLRLSECPGMLADDYIYDFTFKCYKPQEVSN